MFCAATAVPTLCIQNVSACPGSLKKIGIAKRVRPLVKKHHWSPAPDLAEGPSVATCAEAGTSAVKGGCDHEDTTRPRLEETKNDDPAPSAYTNSTEDRGGVLKMVGLDGHA